MSSGLTIYSRSCEEGCSADFSLKKENVECKSEQEEVEKKSCCANSHHENPTKQENEEEDCCDIEAFSLDADFYGFFPSFELDQIDAWVATSGVNDISILRIAEVIQFTNLPPPDLGQTGRSIILHKNSFLI